MRKRLIEKLTNKKKGTLGYTLTEMLVVVGIIAIACAIAIPSIISISKALKFAQANNYAKSIFLAAQQNLTELRSDGGLGPVQAANGAAVIPDKMLTFPDEYRTEYVYTSTGHDAFNLVLPPASIDADVRDDQIIIEYNPLTGNVYAVFYCADELVKGTGASLLELYQAETNALPRDKDSRRNLLVGYYDGSGLNSSQIELEQTQAIVEFVNGEEGVIRVLVPMPESFFGEFSQFASGLEVTLDITGDYSMSTLAAGDVPVPLTIPLDETKYKVGVDGRTVILEFPIDSLANRSSFANYASKTQSSEPGVASSGSSLTTLLDENAFTTVTEETANNVTTKKVYKLLPGENITIQASVTYNGEGAELVKIAPGILSGVNPMFEYLQPSGNGGYILAVANGRNLQNLNAIAPTIAKQVETVVFTSDIYWNDTVAYYNTNYGSGSTYHNTYNNVYDEAPCRALPYFVPIHNEDLFGTARFIFPGEGDGGLGGILGELINTIFGAYNYKYVPTLTDEMDAVTGVLHADIQGNGHRVLNLNINSNLYGVPNPVADVESATQEQLANVGKFYATGENQIVDYYFTGLFGYVNAPVNDLHVVNPIIKGHAFDDEPKTVIKYDPFIGLIPIGTETVSIYNNPATGALIGAGGFNTLVTNCSTYIDKNARGYMNLVWGPYAYSTETTQSWYGISGQGAVGGLVGYAKSHRNVTGELTDDEAVLAFSKCFAAVPVSGDMRTASDKHFGYSNGVGSFIGNSQITNFYNCYASGDVLATGCRANDTLTKLVFGDLLEFIAKLFGHSIDLPYNGRTSWGAGGFVGTSHGTRYTNCFATGNVDATSVSDENLGAGGFVGFMSIDETFTYGNKDASGGEKVAQRTVFTDCYAVGMALTNGATYENFSGANGRIAFNLNTSMSYFVGDYFRLYAPYYANHKSETNTNPVPNYESVYIYRDSYFLSNYHVDEKDQSNSSNCASPDAYSAFVDMVGNHNIGSKWMADEIKEIKNIAIEREWHGRGEDGKIYTDDDVYVTTKSYQTEYFDDYPELEGKYQNLYDVGYSAAYWNNATATTTHPYSLTEGSRYPFTKLKNMDYYGDWPSKPSDLGLAYYETYLDTGKTHYFFDKNHNDSTVLTLREGANVMVKEDGYAIFSADEAPLTVTINGVSDTLTAGAETYTVGKKTYHVFRLSDKLMAVLPADGQFYATVTAKHAATTQNQNPPTYTMYFNSRVAMSHVNPVEDNISAVMPDAAPTTIYIRSARQFKGIATLDDFWGSNYSYIQQLNIDAAVYVKNGKDDNGNPVKVNWTEDDCKVSPIGTAAQPFNASYSAVYSEEVGVDSQYKLSGFQPTDAGFFGAIGANGSVSNLIVECAGALVTSQTQNSVAVLAGVNNGAIDHVTLTITGPVSLTATAVAETNAATNAGLLAGLSTGTVTDCVVTTDDDSVVTISATNAGGLIGSVSGTANKGTEISNTTVNLGAALNVNNSTNAGGYIGYATYVTLEQPKVTVKTMTTDADYAGGLAGCAENTTITGSADANTKEVSVDSLTAEGYAAAVLGGAKNTTLSGVDSTVKSVTAGVAAGFLGMGSNVDADNCTVLVTEKLQGETGAAGVAGTIGPQSVFDHVPVVLTGVTVEATEGNAAGYALEIQGEASVLNSSVTLGSCSKNTENTLVCDQTKHTTISGSSDAAGFACVISGNIGTSDVTGHGTITGGTNGAGYAVTVNGAVGTCHVSPAHSDTDYLGNANSNLPVEGKNAAGFALTVGEKADISNCYTLCWVKGNGVAESEQTESVTASYGFAGTNAGTINRCMANVNIVGGFAFVGENNGLVTTSYGWFDDDVKASYDTILELTGDGKCYSSYFADLNPVKKSDTSVALYDEKGAAARITSSALQNAEIKGFITGYKEYPYGEMEPAEYLYPMLRDHYGNWVTPPQYANGYAYYEKYSDGTYKIHLMDLSDTTKTEENAKVVWCDNFNEDGTIEQAGYAQFFNTQTGDHQGTKVAEVKVGDYTYALYAIGDVGCKTYTNPDDASKSLTIDTRYADAMVEGTAFPADYVYQIRTAGQLANVKHMSAASFIQKHSIAADKFEAIDNFTGKYNGSRLPLTVANGNTWITTLGTNGFVENVNLTVTGAVTAPIFVTVNGKLELDGLNLGSVDQGGALVTNAGGNITSGSVTIGAVSGNVFGTVNGSVRLGDIKVASVSENGSLINLINNATGTVTTGTISVGTGEGEEFEPGTVAGRIFGNSIGKITVGTSGQEADVINTGAVSGQIFGNVGDTTIHGNITVGKVDGKVFGTVTAEKTVAVNGAITIDTSTALNGKIFEGVAGTVKLSGDLTLGDIGKTGEVFGDGEKDNISVNTVNVGNITAKTVEGKIFANVTGSVTINGTISTGEITAAANNKPAGQIFGTVSDAGSVTTDAIRTGAVNGQVFGDVAATTIYGNITTGSNAVSGQVFGNVANATIHGNIAVGQVSGKVFGTVTGTVTINGTITTDTTKTLNGKIFEGVAGTVNLSSDLVLGDIGANGEVFGDGEQNNITVNKVNAKSITATTVDGKIFADVSGTVELQGSITTGAVNGQIFGNVANATIHGNIAVGQVSGQVFGTVNGTVNVNGAISIDTSSALNGKIFEGVAGTVNLSSDLVLGDIGKNGEVFGDGANDATNINNVTVGKITANAVDGMIFAGISGNVNTGTISTGAVNGQIFGDSNGTITVGATGNTEDVITTGAVGGQVFGNVAGTTIHGNITTAGNAVSGKVFGNVNGTVNVNGTITTGTVNGKIFEAVAGTVKMTGDLKLGDIGKTGEVFGDGEKDNISVNTINVGNITAKTVEGKIFANVTGSVTINGTITTGEITAAVNDKPAGQIFGTVSDAGNVTADAISTGAVNGQIFGDSNGNITVGVEDKTEDAIITGAVNGKVFGNVNGTVTVNGTITTGEITAAANDKPAGQIFGTVAASKAVTVNGAITTGAVNGQIFGDSRGSITVGIKDKTVDAITTGAVTGQVFGNVAGTTIHGNITTSGNTVSGKVFGNVNGTVNVNGTITTGAVNGQIFGDSTGTITVGTTGNTENVITTGAVGGKVFGTVNGTVNVNGTITTGAVNGQIFGAVSANVTVTNGISVGNVAGNIFGIISKGTVKPGSITTGDASVDKWLITSVTGGTVQLGSVNVTDTEVPTMIGAISGGTVSGGSVQLGAANTSGSLFAAVTGNATLENFAVTTSGSLGASLIGTVSGNATSSAKAKIDDVNVTATGEAASFTGSGLLINTLGNALVEITGCDVQCGQINVGSKTFGGITGTVPAGVKLSNSTVNATLNVAGAANTVIGGLVGVNSGEVSLGNNPSNVTINYTQPAANTDSATIGGLIGRMDGGKLAGTSGKVSVKGSINLKTTGTTVDSKRSYTIGGAIGEAGDVTVQDVSTAVTVGTVWKGATDKTSAAAFVDTVANAGPVGMFVGYANKGTYTNCFSVAANKTYQFLGQTEIKVVPFEQDTWTSSISAELMQAYSDLVNPEGSYPAFSHDDALLTVVENYTEVSTDLDGCYFYWNGVLQEQKYAAEGNYYTHNPNEAIAKKSFAKNAVVKGTFDDTTLTVTENADHSNSDYYYKVDGTTFGKVTKVEQTKEGFWIFATYKYTIYYYDQSGNVTSKTFEGYLQTSYEFTVWTLNPAITANSKCMIVSDTLLIGEDGSTVAADTEFKERETAECSNYIFTYADSKLTASSDHTVNLVKENHYTSATPEVKFTVEGVSLDGVTQFSLYTAKEGEPYYIYQFKPLTGDAYARQKLTYGAAPAGTVVPVLAAAISLDESDLPGETGEVPEASEATESTEATEVTEPAEPTEPSETADAE